MAPKIQDGGRKILFLWTKKLLMVLKNNHTKNGACHQFVTDISAIASITNAYAWWANLIQSLRYVISCSVCAVPMISDFGLITSYTFPYIPRTMRMLITNYAIGSIGYLQS